MTIISNENERTETRALELQVEALEIEIEELKAANTRLQIIVAENDEGFAETLDKLDKCEKLLDAIYEMVKVAPGFQRDNGYSFIRNMIASVRDPIPF